MDLAKLTPRENVWHIASPCRVRILFDGKLGNSGKSREGTKRQGRTWEEKVYDEVYLS